MKVVARCSSLLGLDPYWRILKASVPGARLICYPECTSSELVWKLISLKGETIIVLATAIDEKTLIEGAAKAALRISFLKK